MSLLNFTLSNTFLASRNQNKIKSLLFWIGFQRFVTHSFLHVIEGTSNCFVERSDQNDCNPMKARKYIFFQMMKFFQNHESFQLQLYRHIWAVDANLSFPWPIKNNWVTTWVWITTTCYESSEYGVLSAYQNKKSDTCTWIFGTYIFATSLTVKYFGLHGVDIPFLIEMNWFLFIYFT